MERTIEQLTQRLEALEKRVKVLEDNQATFAEVMARAGDNDKRLFAAVYGLQIAAGMATDPGKPGNVN